VGRVIKIVMPGDIKRQYADHMSFLGRKDIQVFEAETNDDILKVHIRDKADLIITRIDMPGRRSEELFEIIRSSKGLQNTLSIILSDAGRVHQVRCTQCAPNVVLTLPIDPEVLTRYVLQLLGAGCREARRVSYAAQLLAASGGDPFDCDIVNISSTGILFHTQQDLAQGQNISFSFLLPDHTPIDGQGEILRVVRKTTPPYGAEYAIRMKDVARRVQDAIDSFIAKQK
jgi:CheY-like chemotaxis protein